MTGSIPWTPLASTPTPPAILRMLLRTQGRPCRPCCPGRAQRIRPSPDYLDRSRGAGSHSLRSVFRRRPLPTEAHLLGLRARVALGVELSHGRADLSVTAQRCVRTGQDIPAFDELLPRNAHPPATVLVALPFGWISDYRTAHLVWNLLTLPLLLLSIVLVMRESKIQSRWWSVFTTIALVLPCSAVLSQLYQGQLNFLLLFLLVAAWSADRRGKQVAAGIAVGAATAPRFSRASFWSTFSRLGAGGPRSRPSSQRWS